MIYKEIQRDTKKKGKKTNVVENQYMIHYNNSPVLNISIEV